MRRREAESSCAFKIFWLKKEGYLRCNYSYAYGGVTWTRNNRLENSVGFIVIKKGLRTPNEDAFIAMRYIAKNNEGDNQGNMSYKVSLTTTSCHYGGKRYWFVCPLSKNGSYCGRRVGVLYSLGRYFGCRYCGNIAYSSQMWSARRRNIVSIPEITEAEAEAKRKYYNGRPTRKYKLFLKLNNKCEGGFLALAYKWKMLNPNE